MKRAKRPARPREPLSRERVLRAAIAVADREGVDALSMRKLGQSLGVEAMSLYRHVASRDAILDGICDLVVGEIRLPARDADWKPAMRERALSAHEAILRHPWASTLIESRTSLSPARLDYVEAILGSLRRGGFSTEAAYHAVLVLDSYVYGFALQEVSWAVSAAESAAATQRQLGEIPSDRYPNLTEIMAHHVTSRAARGASADRGRDYAAEFQFGLELILDGLERRRRAR